MWGWRRLANYSTVALASSLSAANFFCFYSSSAFAKASSALGSTYAPPFLGSTFFAATGAGAFPFAGAPVSEAVPPNITGSSKLPLFLSS
jgi:hypothetical protein